MNPIFYFDELDKVS